jgi:predicted nuclease with TOPRIM domain
MYMSADEQAARLLDDYNQRVISNLQKMQLEMIDRMTSVVNDLKEEMRGQFAEVKAQLGKHGEKLEELGEAQARVESDLQHGEKRFKRLEAELSGIREEVQRGNERDAARDQRLAQLERAVDELKRENSSGLWWRLFWRGKSK